MVVSPVPFPARNVVALLPGRDPALKAQYLAIGAHNDHVGMTGAPARVNRQVTDIAVHVANLDHRVAVDKPKPDPKGSCRQQASSR